MPFPWRISDRRRRSNVRRAELRNELPPARRRPGRGALPGRGLVLERLRPRQPDRPGRQPARDHDLSRRLRGYAARRRPALQARLRRDGRGQSGHRPLAARAKAPSWCCRPCTCCRRPTPEGIIINLADMRLYYFATPGAPPRVLPDRHRPGGPDHAARRDRGRAQARRTRPGGRPRACAPRTRSCPRRCRPARTIRMGTRAMYLGWPQYAIHGTNKPLGHRPAHQQRLHPDVSRGRRGAVRAGRDRHQGHRGRPADQARLDRRRAVSWRRTRPRRRATSSRRSGQFDPILPSSVVDQVLAAAGDQARAARLEPDPPGRRRAPRLPDPGHPLSAGGRGTVAVSSTARGRGRPESMGRPTAVGRPASGSRAGRLSGRPGGRPTAVGRATCAATAASCGPGRSIAICAFEAASAASAAAAAARSAAWAARSAAACAAAAVGPGLSSVARSSAQSAHMPTSGGHAHDHRADAKTPCEHRSCKPSF